MHKLGLFQEVAKDVGNLLVEVRINISKVKKRRDGEEDRGVKELEETNSGGPE